jgi:hypothetical protein
MVPEIISVATAITMTASLILVVWFIYVICHMTNVVSFSDTSKKEYMLMINTTEYVIIRMS